MPEPPFAVSLLFEVTLPVDSLCAYMTINVFGYFLHTTDGRWYRQYIKGDVLQNLLYDF